MTIKELLDEELNMAEYDVLLNALGHYRDAINLISNITMTEVDTDKITEHLDNLENKLGV